MSLVPASNRLFIAYTSEEEFSILNLVSVSPSTSKIRQSRKGFEKFHTTAVLTEQYGTKPVNILLYCFEEDGKAVLTSTSDETYSRSKTKIELDQFNQRYQTRENQLNSISHIYTNSWKIVIMER